MISRVGNNHADGRIRTEVLDIHIGYETVIPLLGKEQNGLVIVGSVGLRVQGPKKIIAGVNNVVDFYLMGYCRVGSRGNGELGNGKGKRIIATGTRIWNIPGSTCRRSTCVGVIIVDCSKGIWLVR